MCIKALIVFGADINRTGSNEFTPVDLCIHNGKLDKIESLLFNLGAKSSVKIMKEAHSVTKVPRMHSFAENMAPLQPGRSLLPLDKLSDFINRYGMRRFYQELQQNVDRRFSLSTSNDGGMEEAFALVQQKKELERFNKTLRQSGGGHNTNFSLEGGSRMLFLDGGGIKGLIELEVLMQIEARTGRTILELFDWIVGTSTGGLIALVLVYGGCVSITCIQYITNLPRVLTLFHCYCRQKDSEADATGLLHTQGQSVFQSSLWICL